MLATNHIYSYKFFFNQNFQQGGNSVLMRPGGRHGVYNITQKCLFKFPQNLHHLFFCFCKCFHIKSN